MDIEYIISNIADHFAFQEDYESARNYSIGFIIDYFRIYGMKADSLTYIISVVNDLYKFCKSKDKE